MKKNEYGQDSYRQYIHKSRYARYLDEAGRRETWEETVNRYMENLVSPVLKDEKLSEEIRRAILKSEIMPSMRAMMTAGPAAVRDNTAIYNCSYLPVDSPRSFDEAMFILLCGTGVGFSVEKKNVNQLPQLPQYFQVTEERLVVPDSKEGWANSLRVLLSRLWSGEIPTVDYSGIRPAGARLKTFGGRASGPDPLRELFEFSMDMFINARGRQLTTLEAHDLMCKIGEVVVVGGVRRSAMISLSDLDDEQMAKCKSGNWWEDHPYRALANNSAVYEKTPTMGEFMKEWTSLYESHSGERGIFNRDASRFQAARSGRRKEADFGTNPCSEIILRPYQFCNLTEVVLRPHDINREVENKVRLATILGTIQSTYTHFPYLREIWQTNTEEERLLGVSLTGVYDRPRTFDESFLRKLKQISIDTNKEWAEKLGIPQSTATTCVKPSGTVSQLVDAASGCHPRHAQYYVRRVRGDIKDPLTQFMIAKGVPNEPCVMKPNQTVVFSFPISCPGAITRDDVESLSHLQDWMKLQEHWCEHKPSVTINVKEHEWMQVGATVYDYFDKITGVSFLPHDGGSYRQAPYEECTKEAFEALRDSMPEFSFDDLQEETDVTEGAQQLACVAGVCEI